MRSNYKKLGQYIRQIDIRNQEDKKDNLLGVSTQKIFIESIANTVGTDFTKYKIVKRYQFTYVPDTSRRGDKIGLAMLEHIDEGLVSQAYTVFEVIDKNQLDPEYLMMWFRRPEFDRYSRFKSHGSVREIFDWDEMCNVELPVPSIEKQREIVKEYNTIINRIKLNEQLSQKLEETAQAIYKKWFEDFEFPDKEGKPYKSNSGEMIFNEELQQELPKGWFVEELKRIAQIKGGKRLPKGESLIPQKTPHPYIKVADMGNYKFTVLDQKFEYLENETYQSISRYIVNSGDLIISIVGTIGITRIVDESLNRANLTENCVKVTNIKNVSSDYIYYVLNSTYGKNQIEMKTVGGVQGKLPIYNIETFKIICPEDKIFNIFTKIINVINKNQRAKLIENTCLAEFKNLLLSSMASKQLEAVS